MRKKYDKCQENPRVMNKNVFLDVVLEPRNKMEYLEYLMLKMYSGPDGKDEHKARKYVAMVSNELRKLFDEYKRLTNVAAGSNGCQTSKEKGSNYASTSTVQSDCDPRERVKAYQIRASFKQFRSANGKRVEKIELDKYLAEDMRDKEIDCSPLVETK
ncbi:hypothetical protein SLA2020_049070 [Shorea laevis]